MRADNGTFVNLSTLSRQISLAMLITQFLINSASINGFSSFSINVAISTTADIIALFEQKLLKKLLVLQSEISVIF